MFTQLIEGLLALPTAVRYLVWLQAAQVGLLLLIFLAVTVKKPDDKEKK